MRKPRQQFLLQSPHNKAAYTNIKKKPMSPVNALRHPSGKIVSRADEMDQLLIDSWSTVYSGNFNDKVVGAVKYLANYKDYLYIGDTFSLPTITPDALADVFARYHPSAPGMDGMLPQDFALFSSNGLSWVAQI